MRTDKAKPPQEQMNKIIDVIKQCLYKDAMSLEDSFKTSGNLSERHAATYAAEAHKGQTDHSGAPYIHHPARVAANLKKIAPDIHEDVIMAAWLHDVIEDCDRKERDFRDFGFSRRTIDAVLDVTKPDDDSRDYEEVIDDLIATGNRDAILVKIADNMDNLHPGRVADFAAINPEKSARLVARYEKSIEKLCEAAGIDVEVVWQTIENAKPVRTPSSRTPDQG